MTWPARLPTIARIDWFKVLMDLKRAGLSLETTAFFVEMSKSAVISWKNLDCEPSYQAGERLLALWARSTGLTSDQAPRAEDLTCVMPGVLPPRLQHQRIGCPLCGPVDRHCGQQPP